MRAIILMIGLSVSTPDGPRVGPSGPLGALESRLDIEPNGAFVCERVATWHAPSEAALQSAIEHVHAIWNDCWIAETEDERLSLRWLLDSRPADAVPAVVRNTYSEAWSHRKTEKLVAAWPWWRISVHERAEDGQPVATVRTHDERGVTEWIVVSGRRGQTLRQPLLPQAEMARGFLFDWLRLAERTRVLLELAREQGTVTEAGNELACSASLRSWSVRERFADSPPGAFYEYPGGARLRYASHERGARLEIDWLDCSGAAVARSEVDFGLDASLPERLREVVYLPGTRDPVETVRLSIARRDVAGEALAWSPQPGENVLDQRLLYPVEYAVGVDGSLPEDAQVAAEAEAIALSLGHPPEAQVVPVPRRSRLDHDPGDAAAAAGAPALEVLEPLVELGEQPIGSKHRVRFFLTNVGAEPLILGPLETDCGCLEPRIARPELTPGEGTWISAVQEVQSLGSRRVEIRVPVEGRPASAVTLAVEMTGTEAPLLYPNQLFLGARDAGETVSVKLGFLARGTLADGEAPVVRVEGDLGGDLDVEYDDEAGAWIVTGELAPVAADLFGALEARVVARGSSTDIESVSRVLVDRLPRDVGEAWPTGRVTLRTEAGVAATTLRYPGTHLNGWRVLDASSDASLHAVLREEDGDGVIELYLVAPDAGGRELITCDLELDSSRGRLRLHAIAAGGS